MTMKDIMNSYISLDLETTGLNPKTDKIIEFGAVKVIDGEIRETKSMLLKPHRQLEERITELTGITDEMVAEAPAMEEVLDELEGFCQELPLLGHRILFDYSFFKRAMVNGGRKFERDGADTLALCRKFMPQDEAKNLSSACRYFGIVNEQAHRALSDAVAAHRLYQVLKERFGEQEPEAFAPKPLIYKVKKEQPATKRQKEVLRELIKYHRIDITVQIDFMTRNEVSRMTDKIISQYGRIAKR